MKTCKAPDPNPVKPSWRPPALACDAHCHVFGPADRFPYAPERTYTPPDAPFERLRALHDHLGLERAVLVQASCHGHDNAAMLDAIARSGGRYRGVAMVGADVPDAELARLHAGGVRGVRVNFVRHLGGAPDLEAFERLLARVAAIGWHVVLHFDAEDIATYRDRLDRMPVPFVIDHMGRVRAGDGLGQEPFLQLCALLAANERAWVKVSGPERVAAGGRRPFRDALPFMRELYRTAPDRTLWGTDFPHPNISGDMPNDGELVDLLAEALPDERDRHRVLVENAARLYWAD